jgi:hypothetical protein
VAQGFRQVKGVDYSENFSPVVKKRSIRLLLATAVTNEWLVQQIHVVAAYLNSPIKETVYMEQPPCSEEKDRRKYVCKLERSTYGLTRGGKD